MALKFIPKFGKSESELRALEQEITIMRALRHENIVALYDWLETECEVRVHLIHPIAPGTHYVHVTGLCGN